VPSQDVQALGQARQRKSPLLDNWTVGRQVAPPLISTPAVTGTRSRVVGYRLAIGPGPVFVWGTKWGTKPHAVGPISAKLDFVETA
jgi:hypothetical protein